MMAKVYKSEACAVVHDIAEGLHEDGVISKVTMREFDDLCLAPTPDLSPMEIRDIREKTHLSQPVFARYLNVSKNLVSDWERGVKKPGGPALRLLAIVKNKGLEAISL
jgi:putative transcriptional regulator